MKRMFSCAILCAVISAACKKDNIKPTGITEKKKLAEITQNDRTITLWSDFQTLHTGYNKLYVTLKDVQGNEMKDVSLSFFPLMDMGTKKHSSPAEVLQYNQDLKCFEGAVVFTMPTSETGSWQLDVKTDGNTITFPLTVNPSPLKQSGVYVGSDDQKYILALVPPGKWNIGLNDLNIFISRQVSMMEFVADDDFKIDLITEMPSMEHGSPNNINPESVGKGYYKGKVNYTMTGDWRLHLKLKKNGAVIVEDAYLDVLF